MSCPVCPCSQWTAYWTPPPAWPRRILCESNPCIAGFKCTRKHWIIVAVAFLGYFIVMDTILFSHFRSADLASKKEVSADEVYSPFTRLTIKGLLNDHPSQFIIAPSSEYFDMITHFSTTFSFITPNVISTAHLVCGFIAGKFMSSEILLDRRLGVLLYEFRTWLDAFDGTVHRAQAGLRLQYHSVHNTFGYLVDSVFDTMGGAFLSFSLLFFLLKRQCWSDSSDLSAKSHNGGADGRALLPSSISQGQTQRPSAMRIFWVNVFSFGVCLGVAGKCWDLVVSDFADVFETPLNNPLLKAQQFQFCHSNTTLVLFYLWRLLGGQSVLNYILLVIFMDKTEEFLRGWQYFLLANSVVLYFISTLYINHIKSVLLL